nr:retrovirus-related Pol polyprotein from transposon TNT 1-94 [Tanacetum cinerariifolium]
MEGILRQFSVARTPQQNGVDERRNKTLIEAASTMLADSKLPTTFWAEAVNTACYVQNRVLVVKAHNKTLYKVFHGRTPTLSFMRPFGCHVTILNTIDHLGKFDGKADEGFFIGYSLNNKAFRAFNSRTRIVEENLHIRFSDSISNVVGSGPNWKFDIDALTRIINYELIVLGTQYNGFAGTKVSDNAGQTRKETKPVKYYILLSLWTVDPLFSQDLKSSHDDGSKPLSDDGKKFWSTSMAKTINGKAQLHAYVDGKKIIITEASIRRDLQLADEEGVDCLPNSTIFEQLALMGSIVAFAIICLATNQKFNFLKWIFNSMIRNLDNVFGKFLMYPVRPNPRQHLMNLAPKGLIQVVVLSAKKPWGILLLKLGGSRSLKRNKSRTHKLKRLYKVGLTARVESTDNEESLGEDASKQGRIDAIDQAEYINLGNVQDDAEMFDVNDLGGKEVFVAEQEVIKDVNDNVVEE